jgi:ABC-type sugar transport system ATPase subunit
VGTPIDLYRTPVNRFVAGFIGTPPMNFLEGQIEHEDGVPFFVADAIRIPLRRDQRFELARAEKVTLGIRPEDLRADSSANQSARDLLSGSTVLVERLGGTSHVHFDVGPHRMLASVSNDLLPEVGENIGVHVPAERVHLFAANGQALPRT